MAVTEEEIWMRFGRGVKHFVFGILIIVCSYYIINSFINYLTVKEQTKQLELQLKLKEIGEK